MPIWPISTYLSMPKRRANSRMRLTCSAVLMSLLGAKWSGTRAIFAGSKTASKPGLLELVDGQRRGDVVGQREVDLRLDDVARLDRLAPAGAGQDLLDIVSHQLPCAPAAAALFRARTYAFAEASITSKLTACPW